MPAATFTPGHTLVGRYRIIELLGVGHVAEVYAAEDLSLQRVVVIKVLLAQLAASEGVRRAFRNHIVRVATLSHPHLERVYDGGQESGHIFMVTEYLTGGSLQTALASGQRLDLDDVARLGRDVGSVLSYLHTNDFVHGALSPSSLLFDDEGRVRVSDVALSGLGGVYDEERTFDQVRYLSPEQAVGDPPSPSSDVYALALILFEAATGTVPFLMATPQDSLRARISMPLPVRPELGTLDMLLAQAAVPDARLRLDAEQLSGRLDAVAPDSAPLTLRVGYGAQFVDEPFVEPFVETYEATFLESDEEFYVQSPEADDFDDDFEEPFIPAPTPRPTFGFRAPSPDQVRGADERPVKRIGTSQPIDDSIRFEQRRGLAAPAPLRTGSRSNEETAFVRPPGMSKSILRIVAVLILIVAIGAGAYAVVGRASSTIKTPSLLNLTYQEAVTQLNSDGLSVSVNARTNSSTVPQGLIVSQVPAADVSVKPGTVIDVTVSSGPKLITVPAKLIGEDCVSATARILKVGLSAQCPSSASIHSATVPIGRIAKVLVGGAIAPKSIPSGSTLILALSLGPVSGGGTTTTTPSGTTTTTTKSGPTTTTSTPPGEGLRAVPNIVGLTRAQVYAAMAAAQLYFNTTGPNSNSTRWTTATAQSPLAGTVVKWHSYVLITVK